MNPPLFRRLALLAIIFPMLDGLLFGEAVPAAKTAPECEVFLSYSDLANLRRRVQQKTEPTYTAYLSLQREAEAQLKREPHVPAEWYVPGAYKDLAGHIKAKDSLSKDANSAYALALMYRMTDEPKYALAAIRLIDGWAAGLHGMSLKDDSMLSFSYHFPAFIFSAALLDGFAGWPQVNKQSFKDFVLTKALPMNTMGRENNWGNWGLVLVLSAAVYLHDETLYQAGLERWKHFIETQIAADGSLPLEVVRNNGLGERGLWYTHFCLMPQTIAAELARVHGDDLFDYRSASGHSLRQAYARVVPWTCDPGQFPYYKGQDPNGQKGSDYIGYWEILNARWPEPEATRLLAAKRPLNAHHCTPFLTFTHGK